MYCSSVFKTFDCETVFVSPETGAANKVVANNQKTMDQATSDSAAPARLSSKRIGDQLKIFRSLLPMKPPTALPTPIPINKVAALSAVRVSDDVVDAPVTMSIKDRPSHAPKIRPRSEKKLTNNPRLQPETKMNSANPIIIRSRYNGFNLLLRCSVPALAIQQFVIRPKRQTIPLYP